MRTTKMVRCRILGGRASTFLATCREIKSGIKVDSDGRKERRDYSRHSKEVPNFRILPQESELVFLL